jgi:hypothetical protein
MRQAYYLRLRLRLTHVEHLTVPRSLYRLQDSYSHHFILSYTCEWANKLVCNITLGRKGLPETNTLAYWSHLIVAKKQSVLNIIPSLAEKSDESEKTRQTQTLQLIVRVVKCFRVISGANPSGAPDTSTVKLSNEKNFPCFVSQRH